jgi:GT2 family glycosyltransferase
VWRGGEDLDYVARSLRAGFSLYYEPALAVHHPHKREYESHPDARQGYEYGAGFGRVLRKNKLPAWFASYYLARTLGASVLSLLAAHPRRARFYLAVLRGRTRGWFSGNAEP